MTSAQEHAGNQGPVGIGRHIVYVGVRSGTGPDFISLNFADAPLHSIFREVRNKGLPAELPESPIILTAPPAVAVWLSMHLWMQGAQVIAVRNLNKQPIITNSRDPINYPVWRRLVDRSGELVVSDAQISSQKLYVNLNHGICRIFAPDPAVAAIRAHQTYTIVGNRPRKLLVLDVDPGSSTYERYVVVDAENERSIGTLHPESMARRTDWHLANCALGASGR